MTTTTTLARTDEALLAEYGSTIPAFIEAIETERRGTDAIERAIELVLSHPDVDMFDAFDIAHALKTLNRRNR